MLFYVSGRSISNEKRDFFSFTMVARIVSSSDFVTTVTRPSAWCLRTPHYTAPHGAFALRTSFQFRLSVCLFVHPFIYPPALPSQTAFASL